MINTLAGLNIHGNIDLNNNQLKKVVIDNLVSDPSGTEGKIYYNTVTNKLRLYTSGVWVDLSTGAGVLTYDLTGTGSTNGTAGILLTGSDASTDTVLIVGAGTVGVTRSGNTLTVTGTESALGTVTSVTGTGTVSGLTLTGTVTTSGNLTLGGTLSLTSGDVTTALGFTPGPGTVTSVSGTSPVSVATGTTTPVISMPAATTSVNGYLTSTDWNVFNGKQNALSGTGLVKSTSGVISYITDNSANWDTAYTNRITSLTTTGTGAATLISNVLNIPTPPTATFTSLTTSGSSGLSTLIGGVLNVPGYTLTGLGGVPSSRTLTINGVGYDLTADRSWTIATGTGTVTSVGTGTGLTGGTITSTGTISLNSKLSPADSLTGNALKYLRVNAGETAVEYATASSSGGILHGTTSGTDTYTATITGATAYADGDAYLIRFTIGNTTSATLNINSQGAIPLYRNNDGPLLGGDVLAGGEMVCVYNSTLNIFQCIGVSPNSLIAYVTNDDSVTITKGQPVYAFSGTGDRMTVKLAYNTGDSTSAQTIGLVLSTSIASNQKGLIMMQGLLDGLSILPTATWSDGDPVYLGTTAGSITPTKQYAPNHLVYLGFVTTASNGSAGRLYVRVQNGYELDELHNVQAQTPADKDTLYFDNTVTPKQWKTASISTILGYTPGTVTSVAALTLGTTGTDLSSTVATGTTTPVITLQVPTASAANRGALSSADWTTFNGKQASLSGTGIVKSTGGTISYLTDNSTNWNTAYNRSLLSAAVTGTTTKTLTLNQQDGGTITASWTDINTDAVTSVNTFTGAVNLTTANISELTNLYYTEARVSANANVVANTAKVGITPTQAADIITNNAKITNANHTGDVTGSGALTIGAKKVLISMLADGTDGELITWDAAGVATTVAAGTATHVLTSNGAGAAPTFQAPSHAPNIVEIMYFNTGSTNLSDATNYTFTTNTTLSAGAINTTPGIPLPIGTIVGWRLSTYWASGPVGSSETGTLKLYWGSGPSDVTLSNAITWDGNRTAVFSGTLSQAITAVEPSWAFVTTPTFATNPQGVKMVLILQMEI
jgi:hypothetical protein